MSGGGAITWISRRLRGAVRDDRGVTLVELMVAMTVFAVVMAAALIGFSGAFRLTRDDRSRAVAANLASQEMDRLRAQAVQDFTKILAGTTTWTTTVDKVPYTLKRRDAWITKNPNAGPCDGSTNGKLSQMSVRVSVTWPNMQGTLSVKNQTVLTPPVGVYDDETGHIGVKVLDQTGAGIQGINVLVTGPGYSQTIATDVDGCAFFGFLDPATYVASLNTAGYVSDQGLSNPTQTVAVVVGTITSIQFNYARAATLSLTLSGAYGGTIPANVAVGLGNTHLLPSGTRSAPGTGDSRSIGSLYPFTDGYQVWAGDCLDADPQAQKTDGSGAFYPGATRQPPIGVLPGTTSSGSVIADTTVVTVTKAGVPQANLTVVVFHNADTGCPGQETLTLGKTDTNGQLTSAIPYGFWQYQVSGKVPQGAWPKSTLSPLDGAAKIITVAIQ